MGDSPGSSVGDYEVKGSVDSRQGAIQTLYSAERAMGIALHASTLYTTIANLTYLGVVLGLWFGRSNEVVTLANGVSEIVLVHLPPAVLLIVPLPAWALASYHVVQFAMVTAHGHSISLLERELVRGAGLTGRRNEIGSRAEELRTNVTLGGPAMIVVSILAYGVAFFGVLGLAVVCVLQIVDARGWSNGWTISAIAINSIAALSVACGFRSASRQLTRRGVWEAEEAVEASEAARSAAPDPAANAGSANPSLGSSQGAV
jgi:hypothetical protein